MAATPRPPQQSRLAVHGKRVPDPRAGRPPAPAAADERRLVAALRAGDEAAFAALVDRLTPGLLRVAQSYVPSRAVAEEVVQETWLALLRGLDRFEERSSVKTWLFAVLVNLARTRGARERRSDPVGLLGDDVDVPQQTVPAGRFRPPEATPWPHHWLTAPRSWRDEPEQRLLARETVDRVRTALDALPPRQRAVVALRDVDGYDADEVCDLLGLTAVNQRVLLHRGRARIRQVLEDQLG